MQSPKHTETSSSTGSQIVAQGDQPQQSPAYILYPTPQPTTRGRYITSNDRRGFLPVFEFMINEQAIMMDMDDGYVLWTTIAKALGKTKGDIQRMIEADPELQARVRKTKGGYLKTQGTWIPRDCAEALARKIAWPIRFELIPLFGPGFPDRCLDPSHPDYEQIGKPHQRKRRNTSAAVLPSTSSSQAASATQRERSNTSAYAPGTSWVPPGVQQNTVPTPYSEVGVGSTRPLVMQPAGGISQSPPGGFSLHRPHTMSTDQRAQYHQAYMQQSHPDQRQHSSPSHTPSPTHTAAESIAYTPYEAYSQQQPQQSQQQQQTATYTSSYDGGPIYTSSPPPLHRSSSSQAYYPPQQTVMQQQQPQYVTHEQGYSSHPTTPTHTEFNAGLGEENYAQHDVSGYHTQSYNTYQHPQQNHHPQQTHHHQQSYQQHHQAHQPQHQAQQQQSYSPNTYSAPYASPVANSGTYSPGHTFYPYQPETTTVSTSAPVAQGGGYPYSYSGGPAESHVRYSAEDTGGGRGGYNTSGQQINEESQYGTYPGYETGSSTGQMAPSGGYSPPNHQVQQPHQQSMYYEGLSTSYRQGQQSSPQQGDGSYGSQSTYYSQSYSGMSQ